MCTCVGRLANLDFLLKPSAHARHGPVARDDCTGPVEGIATQADSHTSLAAGSSRIRPLRAPPERLAGWGCMGCSSGVAQSGAFASSAAAPAISRGTRRLDTTRGTVPHAFLGRTRRYPTTACTAKAHGERVTAAPGAGDSQCHFECCGSKMPGRCSSPAGTPYGSATKAATHPQWSISTSRRLRLHARQLAVHAALEQFGLC